MFATFAPTLYVQVSPQRLTVRNPKSGAVIAETPELAIARHPKTRIVGIGAEARALPAGAASVDVVNPFAHPRSMVSDFNVAEQLLKAFLQRIRGRSPFAPSPRVVLHLLGNPAGGYTQVEIRAFHEMALGAGASQVVVWQGRDLSDDELLSRTFPADGPVLS